MQNTAAEMSDKEYSTKLKLICRKDQSEAYILFHRKYLVGLSQAKAINAVEIVTAFYDELLLTPSLAEDKVASRVRLLELLHEMRSI